MLNYLNWIKWSIVIPVVIIIWSVRYKRALRQLMNTKFWIFFVLVTLLTSFVFTRGQPGENVFMTGLLEGLRMNYRAAVVILGLSVIGTELYNPLIKNFFSRFSCRNLPLAFELAIESLPLFVSSIPGFKTIVKKPVPALYHVVARATNRLQELEEQKRPARIVFIVTGPRGKGKTTFVRELKEKLLENNIAVKGILTEKVMDNGHLYGYDLLDISSGKKVKFLRIASNKETEQIGKFEISPAGLRLGRQILSSDSKPGITIIDEVGNLELDDRGWAKCINALLNESFGHLIITVRDDLVNDVIRKWKLDQQSVIFNVAETDIQKAARIISDHCNF